MAERVGIAVALAIGALVRLAPVVNAGGVVGDGGLILALVDDIRRAGLGLPNVASYNQLDIPFAYPPAALWTTAALGEVGGVATLDLLTYLPAILSILGLAAFAWLATKLLPPVAAVGATLAYALMPSAYGWLVAAGGLTRASGLLFALLAMALAVRPVDSEGGWRRPVGVGILVGLSGLCHPQAAVFAVIGCVVLTVRRPIGAWGRQTAIAVVAAIAVLLPWLVWVAGTIGLDALVGAGQRLEPITGLIRLINLDFTGAPFMDVVGVAGIVGLVVSVIRREWRIPTFLLLVSLAGAGGGEFMAAVPWGLLAGTGVVAIVHLARSALEGARPRTARIVAAAVAGTALFLGLIGSLGSVVDQASKLHSLGDDRVAAMRWLDDNAPADAAVLVPTHEVWGYDEISEWLPALGERHSIGTVQGTEWLGVAEFQAQLATHEAILNCAGATVACYGSVDPDAWIFVPKGNLAGLFSPDDCCPALRTTLADAGYEVVYDGPGATIGMPGD
jgi:hypothetical protein